MFRTHTATGGSHQRRTCCSQRTFSPSSSNTLHLFPVIPVSLSFPFSSAGVGLFDLIMDSLTFFLSWHVTGKWSVEQNAWQGWTDGLDRVGGDWKIPECHGWGQSYGGKRVREAEKSRHPGRLLTVQMTPLSHPLSRRMSLPATPSIILTPTAEQHLFISCDRWKRACEDGAGEDHQICCPINYKALV